MVVGTLVENKIIAKSDPELEERSFGKKVGSRLELSFSEALYLVEKEKLSVKKASKNLPFASLLSHCAQKDLRIHEKYTVYKDLRDRGFVVKTGFKFGADFRVYSRGVGVRRGPKEATEHTKWVVFAVPEDYTCSFAELSRAVRLAHSIRARMLWAVVDSESEVTYYEVVRMVP